MSKENKNPFVAGLLNMLLPGSAYLYVDNKRAQFFKTLIAGILVIAAMLALGNAIQKIRGYSLPQGVCTGILLLIVFVPLFLIGQKAAHLHNNGIEKSARYNAQRQSTQGTEDVQLNKFQQMRDEGLISDQEHQAKKNRLNAKK